MTRGVVEGGGGMWGWAGSGEVLCAVYGQPHRDSGSFFTVYVHTNLELHYMVMFSNS